MVNVFSKRNEGLAKQLFILSLIQAWSKFDSASVINQLLSELNWLFSVHKICVDIFGLSLSPLKGFCESLGKLNIFSISPAFPQSAIFRVLPSLKSRRKGRSSGEVGSDRPANSSKFHKKLVHLNKKIIFYKALRMLAYYSYA